METAQKNIEYLINESNGEVIKNVVYVLRLLNDPKAQETLRRLTKAPNQTAKNLFPLTPPFTEEHKNKLRKEKVLVERTEGRDVLKKLSEINFVNIIKPMEYKYSMNRDIVTSFIDSVNNIGLETTQTQSNLNSLTVESEGESFLLLFENIEILLGVFECLNNETIRRIIELFLFAPVLTYKTDTKIRNDYKKKYNTPMPKSTLSNHLSDLRSNKIITEIKPDKRSVDILNIDYLQIFKPFLEFFQDFEVKKES